MKRSAVNILVVDDDPFLATTLASCLKRAFPQETGILVAHTVREAMEYFQQKIPLRAAIVDYDLPDGRGTDFLRTLALRRGRPMALFLISGVDTDQIDLAGLLKEHPQVTFVEKPFRYQDLVHQVRNILFPAAQTVPSFYGLKLFELIQAFYLARKSVTIRILFPDGKMGAVFIREGELVHASMDHDEGMEALAQMAGDRVGELRVEEGCFTAKQTIELATQQALIEAYRRVDEGGGGPNPPDEVILDSDLDIAFREAINPDP